ncbi:GNAT family N-acetyltransferase [Bacillus sinesaloumensis]|uniref:GNAT family N-acetyltransferase n=1 Tax=Litchfieldia sinesaloumensis TaxID=1926280 RepID=UPI0009883153|nr:GNAT family N-acetyltransferase [Bacillus sinesaloumensis]
MVTKVEKATDLEELALFLSKMNKQKETHIGYCGIKVEEIRQTLEEDFINENGELNFQIARNTEGEIVAAVGIDIDDTFAEVWGPYNQTPSVELQEQLWKRLTREYPTVQTYSFFINKENKQQQRFMNEINAKCSGEHLILEIHEQNVEKVSKIESTPFIDSDYRGFEKLHNELFPNTYYDAKTIIERLGNGNILKIVRDNSNELQGYAYFEVDIIMAEASLEYIGIAPSAQNQGLGTQLLKEVVTEMFSFPQITEIKLTVEDTDTKANHVYLKAGFELKDRLISYRLNK